MDIQRTRRSKKSFIRRSKVSTIPVKESPAKFSFSQIKDSKVSSSKTVDFLSLFLNPQAEEQKKTEVKIPEEKHNTNIINKVKVTEEDTLKDLLSKAKPTSSKEKRNEQIKRHQSFADSTKSKRKIPVRDSLAVASSAVVSLKPAIEKSRRIEFIDILNSLLVPPVIEVNIRVEDARKDEKIFIVTLGSEKISKELCLE